MENVNILWYKPMDVEDLFMGNFSDTQTNKCRVIGYLQLVQRKFILQNLKSAIGSNKVQIEVSVDNPLDIPSAIVPQGVQIFGQICWNLNDESSSKNISIKAEVIHFLSHSLLFQMHEVIQKIIELYKTTS